MTTHSRVIAKQVKSFFLECRIRLIIYNMRSSGVNVIKVLQLYFTRVAIVSLAENNNCTCKLQV